MPDPWPAWREIGPDTVTVLGSRWKADAPWAGLDFSRAILREQNTAELALLGPEKASPDHHLDVPWCHPDDQPEGWDDGMMYRVRPHYRCRSYRFVRRPDGTWALRHKSLPPPPEGA